LRFRSDNDERLPVLNAADVNTMCSATATRCRWGCGNQCGHPEPNRSGNETFAAVLQRNISRRKILGGGLAASALLVAHASPFGPVSKARAAGQGGSRLTFEPVSLQLGDQVVVPEGYASHVLIRWGDPLTAAAGGSHEPGTITSEQQKHAFGYNCDFVGYLPLRGNTALLAVNHEYTNPELMFPGYNAASPTLEQVNIELAAHGMSVIEIRREGLSDWSYLVDATLNRRIHGFTEIGLTGPAAGHALMKTAGDPEWRNDPRDAEQLRRRDQPLGHRAHMRGELQPVLREQRTRCRCREEGSARALRPHRRRK
jgi:uncharacterized protein